ncbi:hypothetical protein AB182_17365 [Phytobacter ursingii]|uniref:Uncharacterized protein n=1 Tax=Phytobacter ursingii TaxID=1972431 RepID=A0AAC8TN08_9ENTR|nr:hypothetical protein AB182_17365 [Phytobacter ursingii]
MLFDSAGAGRKWCIRSAKCEHDRMIIRRFVSRYSAKISEKKFLLASNRLRGRFRRQAKHMGWKQLSTIPVDNLVH